jgi:hypothetical protein
MMSVGRLSAWLRSIPREVDTYIIVLLPIGDEEEKIVATYPAYSEADVPHDQFANQVLAEIQNDCDCNQSVSRYDVRAQSKKTTITSRTVKAIPTPEEQLPDPLGISNSPAGGNNAMSQLVRMNEAALRMLVQSFGTIQKGYKDLLETQRNQIETLLKREAQLADNVLLELAKQADIDESDIRANRAIDKITELVEKYAPAVLNNLPADEVREH